MPKPEHRLLFGPKNPLPWVPDRVGTAFSRENAGVLVVGSSYNGFIEGYSTRSMKLESYLAIRDLILEGNEQPAHPKVAEACAKFVRHFEDQVMAPDRETYYGPIFDDLLRDVPASKVCLTDLCKASYVQRNELGNRQRRDDYGGDKLICGRIADWARYLTAGRFDELKPPLPYQWLWRRIQSSCLIIPLGVIAEHGVLKVFNAMLPGAIMESRKRPQVIRRSNIDSLPFDWEDPYQQKRIPAARWHTNDDWLVLSDGSIANKWYMLPVYHPNFRSRSTDPDYARSRSVLGEMQNVWTALSRLAV